MKICEVIPRKLGTKIYTSNTNEMVHADYVYMGEGVENMKYVFS